MDNFKPSNVWCKGVRKIKDYNIVQNVEKIYEEAESVVKRLWEHIKES